jgi:hypothetical protein
VLYGAVVVGVMGGVLYGAAVVNVGTTVCAQQQLEQQQRMLPVRSVVRRTGQLTVRGSVSVRWTGGCPWRNTWI